MMPLETNPSPPSPHSAASVVPADATPGPPGTHVERMAVLGELLGTTVHEFNNVLMTIINFAKLGLRNTEEAVRTNALQKILAAGERAAKITNTILATARDRHATFEPTDLKLLLDDVLFLMEREFKKYQIQVRYEFEAVPPVHAIPIQIQQVVLNLLVNARQAMPHGGEVRIGLTTDRESQMVALSIRDTGRGIPREILPRIFEPYFSTKAGPDATGRGGTGLGLSACAQIIQAHAGRIRVQSTVGKGTCFTIRLPIHESQQNSQPQAIL